MNTHTSPSDLAIDLLSRSTCAVQVAAVLADGEGIFAWGWNHAGPTGLGQHAEAHCLSRANTSRLAGATMWVAARRQGLSQDRQVTAKPCSQCAQLLRKVGKVIWRDKEGKWRRHS